MGEGGRARISKNVTHAGSQLSFEIFRFEWMPVSINPKPPQMFVVRKGDTKWLVVFTYKSSSTTREREREMAQLEMSLVVALVSRGGVKSLGHDGIPGGGRYNSGGSVATNHHQ